MKLRIFGAAGEVTGSNYMIETAGYRVLVDCGTHQGEDEERHEGENFPYDPAGIDAVLLTHAHIDHSGRLPLLVRQGFKGKIYCTHATSELIEILLRDSAKIMKEDAEWRTRKNARKGLPAVKPLYGDNDVEDALALRSYVPYDEVFEIMPGLKVRFRDAGHILGSAIIEAWISEKDEKPVKVVFSGDLGPLDGVIEKPPAVVEEADFVLIESTYGDRLHKSLADTRAEFQDAMEAAVRSGGKVLVPTFVVDRAQRMLYEFKLLQKKLPDLKMANIYLDSPMGVKTTEIYSAHAALLSRDLKEMLMNGEDPFEPRGFSFVRTAEESRAINAMDEGIVLAGSGMCSGGRIMHHLKHSLYKKDTHVFFVGYQAYGTLGRRLVDGAKKVRIAGEEISVKAKFHTLNGFSAHADRGDLLSWASHFPKKARFIIVHGEPKSAESLALGLKDAGYATRIPAIGDEIDLLAPAPERAEMPVISKRILDRIDFDTKDVESVLNMISERTDEMREKLINNDEQYRNIMPLLISARTLLETAAALGAGSAREGKG
ncbi:MBL fold metallo-hydrolase [Cloacibacillus sp. An23]|uniref:MBL fold metallo-hydrolase RNA specificity domain-containing protein n=1 Tax=Cloacibacillus sp. An23 TaxID=1965591 RepID=UPI000B39ADC7|nr:MBL fold metallo-hydrolase [Cloacibacillus sp. An23]OUO94329.1 MBL fold hydrolase [Cloacibacillus sp. An23]